MALVKTMSADDAVSGIESGMTIGIGGWGSRRKPMTLLKALLRTGVDDLTVVSYGGPDIGILCAAGRVRRVVFAFVTLDSIPLEPHFRAARESGAIETEEYDEGMFLLGLQAAAWRVPFLPTRVGLGSDILRDNDRVRLVTSPFDDDEQLVAVPALTMDAAFVHMNRSDARGNGQYLGPDPYMDDLFLGAAERRFLSTEKVVATEDLAKEGPPQSLLISRLLVDGVIEAPNGAHFTSCDPDYPRDEAFQRQYAAAAKSPDAWAEFRSMWLDLSETDYQARLRADGGDA